MTNLTKKDSYRLSYSPSSRRTVQCVLVGDAKIGKTSLIVSYTTNGYPGNYVPTAYDKYAVNVQVDDQLINLELCDTAGRNEFDSLRKLSYFNADVFLLCFNVTSRLSFTRLQHMWLSEMKGKCTNKPTILVGTQCDLRTNLETIIKLEHIQNKGQMEAMVSEREAFQFSKEIGALTYIESSALTQRNLKKVFDTAILATLLRPDMENHDNSKMHRKNYSKNCYIYQHHCNIDRSMSQGERMNYKIYRTRDDHEIVLQKSDDNKLRTVWKKFVKLFS